MFGNIKQISTRISQHLFVPLLCIYNVFKINEVVKSSLELLVLYTYAYAVYMCIQ